MYKKHFYFFNLEEVCTENYHLRINSYYRLALKNNGSIITYDVELKKIMVAADLIKMEFQSLDSDKKIKIKFSVFSNVERNWKVYDLGYTGTE